MKTKSFRGSYQLDFPSLTEAWVSVWTGVFAAFVRVLGLTFPVLLCVFPSWCQTVNHAPRLIPTMVGRPDVGVHATGSVDTSVVFSSLTKQDFTQTNSYTVTASAQENTIRTETVTPKPTPTLSGWLSGVTGMFSGDYSKMVNWVGGGLDAAVQPNNDDWKSVYTGTRASGQQQSNASSLIQEFEQQVQQQTSSTVKFDLNGGYIQLALRITNTGSAGVSLRDPIFTLYFLSSEKVPILQGSTRAFQIQSKTTETFYLGPRGSQDTVDLTLRIDGLNYQTLCQQYAQSQGLLLIFENPEIVEGDGKVIALQNEFDNWSATSIHVRIVSDSYNFEAYVSSPPQGLTLVDVLKALKLPLSFDRKAKNTTLAVTSVGVDANVTGTSDPRSLSGQQLINWRRWVTLGRSVFPYNVPSAALNPADQIPQGGSVYLFELTAKDVLGPYYRPAVSTIKDVKLRDAEELDLGGFPLEAEDEVVLSNVRLMNVKRDVVTYQTRAVSNIFYSGPIGGIPFPPMVFGTESSPVVPPPRPSIPLPAPLSAHLGDSFILAEPTAVSVSPVSSFVDLFQIDGASSLPSGFPVESLLKFLYAGFRLQNLQPESDTGSIGFLPDLTDFSKGDWTDPVAAASMLGSVTFRRRIETSPTSKWLLSAPATVYNPLVIDQSANGSSAVPNGPTHWPTPFVYFVGHIPIWNLPHVCALSTVTDVNVCAAVWMLPQPWSFFGVTRPALLGNTGLFEIICDVTVVRLGGR